MSSKVARIIANTLNGSSFNCSVAGCNKLFKYTDAAIHSSYHKIPELRCVQNCGDSNTFKGIERMKTHIETTCDRTRLKCTRCNLLKSLGEIVEDVHNCEIEIIKAADQT